MLTPRPTSENEINIEHRTSNIEHRTSNVRCARPVQCWRFAVGGSRFPLPPPVPPPAAPGPELRGGTRGPPGGKPAQAPGEKESNIQQPTANSERRTAGAPAPGK